eukprot:4145278-Alexandrium_andersonii.AAC.1
MDELERYQMEKAIRDSEKGGAGACESHAAPSAGAITPPLAGASPRTTQHLQEVQEVAWLLVAQHMAWE